MHDKDLKEAFVSNLNGTSLGEISLGSVLAPLCLISRGLVLILYFLGKGVYPFSWKVHLFLDFTMVVVPLVLSCTVLSDVLLLVILGLAAIDVSMLFQIYHKRKHTIPVQFHQTLKTFLETRLDTKCTPFVTVFRVLVNVKTAISILAVDFEIFPRRYAKTETYGTGVMDFGVGAFILANSLVSPEARQKQASASKFSHVTKQLLSVWPLVVLGMVRLISVKALGYHEHVSEYGVHWNFFFTLAIVRVVASLLLTFFPANKSWIVSLAIGAIYQTTLELTELKAFILHGSDRTGGFLSANREGVFSVIGYVAIYMAGVQGSPETVESSCTACGSTEETSGCVEVIVTNESTSCCCPGSAILGSPKTKKGLSPHCNGSDCGYSSSMEGSETGSREGSDVACTEGICNHDEADDSCVHRCVEDKEEDGVDSCVECWANSEENTKGKNKKKKKKNKGSACGNDHLPWAERRKALSHFRVLTEASSSCPRLDRGSKSLMELLDESEGTSDEENCLTQDEIQSFVANNQSFYNNRDQYRLHLKERFTKYCHSNEQEKHVCNGGWLATAGAN
ncbi:UNVERIFIED_CONTAM: hypothetical protein FKN15_053667 [Acipenser sinensis]